MEPRDPATRWLFRLGHHERRPADEVDCEIEHHLAEQTDRLVRQGWLPGEARAEAKRRFGSLRRYRPKLERIDRRRMTMRKARMVIDAARDGLRQCARTFRRAPGFALGIVMTLGLGLGANAAMFGIVDRILLRPPDHIVEADRVQRVAVWQLP